MFDRKYEIKDMVSFRKFTDESVPLFKKHIRKERINAFSLRSNRLVILLRLNIVDIWLIV